MMCKNIDVSMEKMTLKQNIFIVNSVDRVLVFKISFMIKAQAQID